MVDGPSVLELSQEIGNIKSRFSSSDANRLESRVDRNDYDNQEYWEEKLEEAEKVEAARNSISGYKEGLDNLQADSFGWLEKAEEHGTIEVKTDTQHTGRLVQHQSQVRTFEYDSPQEAINSWAPGLFMEMIERRPHVDRLLVREEGNSFDMHYEWSLGEPRFDSYNEFVQFYSTEN